METDGGDVDERGRNSESRYIRRRERGREWYYTFGGKQLRMRKMELSLERALVAKEELEKKVKAVRK